MRSFWKPFFLYQRIEHTKGVNMFRHGLTKIPIIGKQLGWGYRWFGLKNFLFKISAVISIIFSTIKSILLTFPLIGIYLFFRETIESMLTDFGAPTQILNSMNSSSELLQTGFVFSWYFVLLIIASRYLDDGYTLLELRRGYNFSFEEISNMSLYQNPLLRYFGRTVAFIIIALTTPEFSVLQMILLSTSLLLLGFASNAFWIHRYEKMVARDEQSKREYFEKQMIKQNEGQRDSESEVWRFKESKLIIERTWFVVVSVIASFLLSFVASLFIKIRLSQYIFPLFILSVIFGVIAIRYLKQFSNYGLLIERGHKVKIETEQALEEINRGKSILKDSDYIEDKSMRKDKGYAYLNRLFFLRHRRVVRKPIFIKTAVVYIFAALFFLSNFFLKGTFDDIRNSALASANGISNMYIYYLGIMPIVTYIICKNENIIKAMFFNCDRSLMRYGFYRRDKDLIKMFWHRLLTMWRLLALPMSGVFVILAIMVWIFALPIDMNLFMTALFTVVFWLFFSALQLFVYYILQPYNSEGELASYKYSIFNFLVYNVIIFMLPTLMPNDAINWSILMIVTIACAILSIIGILMMYKLSPKTFRFKR